MTPWLLIPAKSLSDGKSRLKAALDDEARERLNRLLFKRALAAASSYPGAARTAVVSESTDVLDLAAEYGTLPIVQATGGNLNHALVQGVSDLRRRGAGAILIVAADLPLITVDDLRTIADSGNARCAVGIWTDKHRSGTNALYLPPNVEMEFRFGPGSGEAHYRSGVAAAGSAWIEFGSRIAFDIDTPEDLRSWSNVEDLEPEDIVHARASMDARVR